MWWTEGTDLLVVSGDWEPVELGCSGSARTPACALPPSVPGCWLVLLARRLVSRRPGRCFLDVVGRGVPAKPARTAAQGRPRPRPWPSQRVAPSSVTVNSRLYPERIPEWVAVLALGWLGHQDTLGLGGRVGHPNTELLPQSWNPMYICWYGF